MATIRILEKQENLHWEYDEEADVLYISVREPAPALSVDAGEGVIVRYREETGELVGLTIIGVKERTLAAMK